MALTKVTERIISDNLSISGIATASNFKTGTTNVHNVGVEAAGINVLGGDTPIGTGATIYKDGGARFSGIVTATSFYGDISNATGAAAGLGTALSQTQTDPLNKIYYTDSVLSIGATITIDTPSSASAAYTQYTDIVADGADIIVADGDDFVPDILGISTDTVPSYSGSGGRIRAGKFTNTGANGAPTATNGWIVTGVNTATTFKGAVDASTGAFSSNVTISGNLGVAGTITYEDVARVDATGISTFREGFGVGPLAGIALTAYKDGSIRTSGIITASSFVGDGSGLTGAGPTLANGSNNRVITATGANALTGESNLTFTGSNLTVNNGSGASEVTLVTPSNTDGGIYFNDGSNVGALSYLHTDNSMRFRVNSQSQLHIKSDHTLTNVAGTTKFSKNSVGIGTTTTAARIAGVGTANGTFQFDVTSQSLVVYNNRLGWLNVQTEPYVSKFNTNSFDVNRKEFLVMEIIRDMGADFDSDEGRPLRFVWDANSTYAWHGGDSEVVDQCAGGLYGATSNVSWVEKSGDASGYYQFNGGSGNTYISLGTRLGNNMADTNSQYALCCWIYDPDWTNLDNNQWWVLNDGDWSPTGSVGIRIKERGTSGELAIRGAIGTGGDNNTDKFTTGWPTSGWIFIGLIRSINQMDQNKYEMYQSYRGFPSNTDIEMTHNLSNMAGGEHDRWGSMYVGARPDSLSEDNKQGSRLGSIAFWSRHDGQMMDGSSGGNTSQVGNWFNTIFKKTRHMYQ